MNRFSISGYTIIRNNSLISSDYENFTFRKDADFTEFSKALYQLKKVDYPKFYKMDNLCKLSFIGAEVLVNNTGLKQKYPDEEVGIILCNQSSSIDSDSKHVESFVNKSNYYPSPSIFVYTLPNISIGEICIRHSIKGENALFITEGYDVEFSVDYIKSLMEGQRTQACIGGWIEFSVNGYEAFLFSVENENRLEQKNKYIPFSIDEISKIYSKY